MIKEEDLVVVIDNGVLKKGKVKYFENRSIALVWFFDDKQLKKVHIDHIAVDNQEEKKEKTPVEKESITITDKEFINISSQIISEEYAKLGIDDEFTLLSTAVIFGKICEALFMREENQQ